jgi:EAL domain-containing protein (putative c-di-GMP-specific phosphodiesterase class I)
LYPEDGDDPEMLLKRADAAMYHAKEQGRNGYRFYSNSINLHSMRLMKFKAELRQALEQNRLQLHFQPRFNLRTGQLLCLESLVRWHHPDRGILLPAEFIPLAEETGLIVPLGEWVLRNACVQIKAWQNAGLEQLSISVNLSALQFNRKYLVEQITGILQETGVSAQHLELELTESTLMENIDESVTLLGDLKKIGVKLSIDNFGTGFSSLSYLKRFPIDALKIERSYIHDLITDVDDTAIVASTIALAHNLGFKVVAEGVEREAQLKYLKDRGCDAVQGYLFSRPMAPESFMPWFEEKRQTLPITSH